MKKWEILNKSKLPASTIKLGNVLKILLENRKLKTKKEIKNMLNELESDD